MKDFFGQELRIGDVVAFNPPRYKGLRKGTVTKFTPQMVEVEYEVFWCKGRMDKTRVYPRDTVKQPVELTEHSSVDLPKEYVPKYEQ